MVGSCQHRWTDLPGAFAKHKVCPRCGSLYWTWKNAMAFTVDPGEPDVSNDFT